MKLERTLSRWANMSPKAAASMSQAAVTYLASDAQKDIAALSAEIDRLRGVLFRCGSFIADRYHEGDAEYQVVILVNEALVPSSPTTPS